MKQVGWLLINAVQGLFLCVWTLVCVVLAAIIMPFSHDRALRLAPTVWVPPLMWVGGIRMRIERPEIDWSRPHIFVMNHQSMLDIPAAFLAIPVPLRFIAKKSLGSVPFLGWFMRSTRMILVDRGRSAQAVASMQEAGKRIREGASIIAFPEGTRSPDGRIRPFKKGVFMVALQTGVPIVPMAIEGARDVLPPNGFRPRPGRIRLKIGAPIPTEGLGKGDRDELIAKVRGTILRMHREVGGPGGDEHRHVAARREGGQASRPVASPPEEGPVEKRTA